MDENGNELVPSPEKTVKSTTAKRPIAKVSGSKKSEPRPKRAKKTQSKAKKKVKNFIFNNCSY